MRSWRTVVALLALLTVRSEDALRSLFNHEESAGISRVSHLGTLGLLLVVGGILAVLALLLLLNWVSWRATSFRITESSVEVRSGIVVTQHRNARLDRVQAIDVVQPFMPRLFGLAELSFDVAGSGSRALRLSMLKRADAESLRETIMARGRGIHDEAADDDQHRLASTTDPNQDVPPVTAPRGSAQGGGISRPPRTVGARVVRTLARESAAVGDDLAQTLTSTFAAYGAHPEVRADGQIVHVPPHRILVASLLRPSTFIAVIWLLIGITSVIVGSSTGNSSTGWGIAFTTLVTAVTFVHSTVQNALRQANFSAALTSDGLLITQGVTSTERRLIPLDRIQAVGIEQPLLWRPFGWWKAHYNIASQTASEDVGRSVNVLLPVGFLDDAIAMLSLALPIAPDGSSDARTTGELVRDATGVRPAHLHGQPGTSRWLDPLSWRVNGWARSDSVTVIRRGRIRRRISCVPHTRVQSLALHSGPFQRRLGLASVSLHSTAGPVGAGLRHQPAHAARELLFELATITRDARRTEQARLTT